MADVGDRIAVVSKGQPRSGVVIAVRGAMITVRWATGGETSLFPGPGVLSVVTGRRSQSTRTRPPNVGAAAPARKKSAAGSRVAVAKKAAAVKKVAAGRKVATGRKVA